MVRFSLSLLLLLASACTLELDQEISCGDGYVDRTAGEVCDPESPASFENACQDIDPSRAGVCDATTCRLDLSACLPSCGNGDLDPGEECDPGSERPSSPDAFGSQRACTTLSPDDGGGPYVGGATNRCLPDCTWDRSPCNRCGDNRIQDDEVCDGDIGSLADFDAYCLSACVRPEDDERPDFVRCGARCTDDCQWYEIDPDTRGCCIPTDEPAHSRIPCCGFEEDGICVTGLGGG